MAAPLVVGVDAGATSTRCLVATVDGCVLARGRAGGANRNSSAEPPAEALASALRAALTGLPGAEVSRVALGVVGAAGAAAAGRVEAEQAAGDAWRAVSLPGRVVSTTDLEVAFAAGAAAGTGLLLLSGTGAAAVAFDGGVPRHRCDGFGWLLGDEGSAVWLGLRAVRAVLAAIDGRGAPTALTGPVTEAMAPGAPEDPDGHAQALVHVAYRQAPARLGGLAPLVAAAAAAGDPVADGIVADAAGHLLHSLRTAAERAATPVGSPVVLAGALLLSPGPVADRVRTGIREGFGVEPADARDGAAGAAALAIARLTGRPVAPDVHARLTGQAG